MRYALKSGDTITELPPGKDIVLDEVHFSWATMELWQEAERNAHGIYAIIEQWAAEDRANKLSNEALSFNGAAVIGARTAVARTSDEIAAWDETHTPLQVLPLQFRRALRQLGQYDAVVAYVNAQGGDVLDAWQSAVVVVRTDPLVATAAASLGMSASDVQALFQLAATK